MKMNPCVKQELSILRRGLALGVVFSVGAAAAADFTWLNTPASGNWNLTDENWSGTGTVWANGAANSAFFGVSETTNVMAEAVTLQHLTFNADGYAISGGPLLMYGSPTVGAGLTATLGATVTNVGVWTKGGAGTLTLNPGMAFTNMLYSMKVATGTLHVVSGTTLVTMPNSDPENGPAFWVEGGTLVVGGGLLKTTTNKYARVSGGGSLIVTNGLVDLTNNDELLNAHNTAGTTTVSGSGILDVRALRISQQYGPAANAVVNVNTGGTIKLWNFNLDATTKKLGTVNFNGGTIVCKSSGAELLNTGHTNWSGIVAFVREGGAIIDTFNNSVTIRQALQSGAANDGGLTKKSGGNLNLRGTNTYVGGTFLLAGSLNIVDDNNLGAVPASPATNFTFVGNSTLMSSASHALSAKRTLRLPHNVTATFDTQSYTQTVNGVIYGEGTSNQVVKLGTGLLVLDPGPTSGFSVRSLKPQAGTVYVRSGSNLVTAASSGVQALGLFLNGGTLLVGGGELKTTGGGYLTSTGSSLLITNGVVNIFSCGELLNAYSGSGNVTVSGSGTLVVQTLRISQAGGSPDANVVNVNTGGVIRMHRFYIDEKTQSKGRVNFNGGTCVALSTRGDFLGIANTNWYSGIFPTVREGGAIIDSNGFDIDSLMPLYSGAAADGGLTKKGAGSFTLNNTNTYNGVTTVLAGKLKLGVATNTLPVGNTVLVSSNALFDVAGKVQTLAGLGGSGTVTNNSLLTVTGTVAPGGTNAIGTLTLAVTPAELAGSFTVDVSAEGACDRLAVVGNLNLSGLALNVANTALLNKAFSYTVATYTGTQSGSFVSSNLPLRWNVKYDAVGHRVYLSYNAGTLVFVQ